ncbi:MAG: flagellar motor protein MotB [Pseudomonadota bacterium]
MAADPNRPVIIRRKKKSGEHAHHGGAWKVAYADFVTAMMAFFLLLWLLNVTTDEQKHGIANYFTPEYVSRSMSGSGGVLGGLTLSPDTLPRTSGGVAMSLPVFAESEDAEEAEADRKDEARDRPPDNYALPDKTWPPDDSPLPADKTRPPERTKPVSEDELNRALARREEAQFAAAEHDLRQAIQDIPELRQLTQNLIVDRTPEGLRIQIVDQARTAMFPLGSAVPHEHARQLLHLVARVVQRLPNRISVTGHTDSTPFAVGASYSNWELSSDRANSSRRTLIEVGLSADRITRVVGKADQEALVADDPADPRNRRISIVLLRDNPAAN